MEQGGTNNKKVIVVIGILAVLLAALIVWALVFFQGIAFPSAERGSAGSAEDVTEASPVLIEVPALAEESLFEELYRAEQWIDVIFLRDDQIYLSYRGPFRTIVAERLSLDGTLTPIFQIPWERGDFIRIAGFSVTDAGYFRFLIEQHAWDGPMVLFDVKYDAAGELVFQHELTEVQNLAIWDDADVFIWHMIFTDTGETVIQTGGPDDGDSAVIVIVNQDGIVRGVLETEMGMIQRIRDGRIVFSDDDGYLREIDTYAGDWGETFSDLSVEWLLRQTVPQHAPFDLYFSAAQGRGWYLFGYDIARGEVTSLFDWDALEESLGYGFFTMDIFQLSDGRFVLLQGSYDGRQTAFLLFAP